MLKKLIFVSGLLFSAGTMAETEWNNEIYAEKSAYSYSASISADSDNRFEYRCSVLKIDNSEFGKIDYLNVDLDLKLEDDKLNFQEKYEVNLIFSNGKEYKNALPLKSGFNGLDRFTFYLSANETESEPIIGGLLYGNYVNVEIVDSSKKRMLYRFYLKGSKKAITKSKSDCELLYRTFK